MQGVRCTFQGWIAVPTLPKENSVDYYQVLRVKFNTKIFQNIMLTIIRVCLQKGFQIFWCNYIFQCGSKNNKQQYEWQVFNYIILLCIVAYIKSGQFHFCENSITVQNNFSDINMQRNGFQTLLRAFIKISTQKIKIHKLSFYYLFGNELAFLTIIINSKKKKKNLATNTKNEFCLVVSILQF
eukprot:TRINITY_DN6855_c0_g1_i2.p2 TRINITY_DN6855_c0_g1~~TRINITY_DN6855_c0_g1_i2.p2  ORF type:complete len:183 (+),score=1.12 TRINITY_DN6855_c0_g1_i2:1069-1617(+)